VGGGRRADGIDDSRRGTVAEVAADPIGAEARARDVATDITHHGGWRRTGRQSVELEVAERGPRTTCRRRSWARAKMVAVTESSGGPVAAAREALRRGDAAAARTELQPLLGDDPPAAVLELVGRADYVQLDYRAAIGMFEQAYGAYRSEGDHVGAVRVARTLAPLYGTILGEWAVGNGWLARAQRVLSDTDESAERGWVALNLGLFETDRALKHERFGEALEVARNHRDADLEVSSLAYLGASMVHAGDVDEGMRLLDEALAAVAGREVDDFCVIEEVFCQLFSACEHVRDVARADQWIGIGESIAARRGLPAVSAFCRTHYGGVLTAAGRWAEADEALTAAIRLWAVGRRSGLRAGAVVRLADLRVQQGRVEEADQLLAGLDAAALGEATRPRAAVHLARGDLQRAAEVLDVALAGMSTVDRSSAPLLELLVEVHVRAGDLDAARAAADRLAACADCRDSNSLRGAVALARGRLAAADGDDAVRWFREAIVAFDVAQMPMQVAHARLECARARTAHGDPVATDDARAAHAAFVELDAPWHADAAAALLRGLGAKPAANRPTRGVLTKREVEVFDLLGRGLSNPEIADRLFISRKTVEHHVSNVLAKLGLRSRAEAAALAARALVEGPVANEGAE
jgi:DNA-binding NarL/FixJ family response regulator